MSGTNKVIVSELQDKSEEAIAKALENANEEAAKIEDKGE
jgi:hypothetical protein